MTDAPHPTEVFDVVVIGGGAAGLMCALTAGGRGRRVLVLDHANRVGKKILMSGGGRCNFTNLYCEPENFISANPHFVKSALSRYSQWDFIALVEKHGIPYHEKKLGQLFCDRSSRDIVRMLLDECAAVGVVVRTDTPVRDVQPGAPNRLAAGAEMIACESLVIATGGYSIPRMGATGFGLDLAHTLGLSLQPTRPALVPFTLSGRPLQELEGLSGVALDTVTTAGGMGFRENLLFTHRGLSGPAVLQASSYWEEGQAVTIDLFPELDLSAHLQALRAQRPKLELKSVLGEQLTRRVAQRWCELWVENRPLEQLSNAHIEQVVAACQPWTVWPSGTEGYRTAEVTLGGVDAGELSSKTMECRRVPGVYFIGEVVDVTGHLGGHNFQWAWASGHAAGEHA
ncbi:NAD(P)/FAD-dependent oxidoreductase [Thioalkalivibrio sp. ALJT]|uniref:NAD(P)/FAD-dependent oxidoreductase n=1 Tax=Thioalkalivibrio sp. ALJT TaxID=1158146 RepID=UPI00039C3206|nr:NAD(P)/FAD-dependent oxidoreductase [Thioalkalivibrio sp. ALJT]